MDNFSRETASDNQVSGLLSLVFDCSAMVDQLSRGLELEYKGDHQSAVAELNTVINQIDSWLDKLGDMETCGVDKTKLIGDLKEAKRAVEID